MIFELCINNCILLTKIKIMYNCIFVFYNCDLSSVIMM